MTKLPVSGGFLIFWCFLTIMMYICMPLFLSFLLQEMTSAVQKSWRQKSGACTEREIVWRGWWGNCRRWAQEVETIWPAWRSNTTRSNWSCRRGKPSPVSNIVTQTTHSIDTINEIETLNSRSVFFADTGGSHFFTCFSFICFYIDLYRVDISIPHICCQCLLKLCFQPNYCTHFPLTLNPYWKQLYYWLCWIIRVNLKKWIIFHSKINSKKMKINTSDTFYFYYLKSA